MTSHLKSLWRKDNGPLQERNSTEQDDGKNLTKAKETHNYSGWNVSLPIIMSIFVFGNG